MKRYSPSSDVVANDMSWNILILFIALFVLAWLKMNPEREKKDPTLETEGKFAVVLQWPGDLTDDVDLYVMDPAGNIAYFQSRDAGLMHLERDDLGDRNDAVETAAGRTVLAHNEERVIIRGIVPGEYVVNVHLYRMDSRRPVPATIILDRLRGEDNEIVKQERTLAREGDEKTAFRFTLSPDETVSGINELPRQFVGKALNAPNGGIGP